MDFSVQLNPEVMPRLRVHDIYAGVLRRHKRHKDGSLRDTWSYSIIADEWPAIRDRLDARLAAG